MNKSASEIFEMEEHISRSQADLVEDDALTQLNDDLDFERSLKRAVEKYNAFKARIASHYEKKFDLKPGEYDRMVKEHRSTCRICDYMPQGTVKYIGPGSFLHVHRNDSGVLSLLCSSCLTRAIHYNEGPNPFAREIRAYRERKE